MRTVRRQRKMKRRSRKKATREAILTSPEKKTKFNKKTNLSKKTKVIYKQLWVPKWVGPPPSLPTATFQTHEKLSTEISAAKLTTGETSTFTQPPKILKSFWRPKIPPPVTANTSSSQASSAYRSSVHSRLAPLLPKPRLTALSLAISYFDLSTFFVALSKQRFQTVSPSTSMQKDLHEVHSAEEGDAWIKVLPKKMKSLQIDHSPQNISLFIKNELRKVASAKKCFNCLMKGHVSKLCKFSVRCLGCDHSGHSINACPLILDLSSSGVDEQSRKTSLNTEQFEQSKAIVLHPTLAKHIPLPTVLPKMAQPPPVHPPANPNLNAWLAMNPVPNLQNPDWPENWEHAPLPTTDEFYQHRPERHNVFLEDQDLLAGEHAGRASRAIYVSFRNGAPLENASHGLSVRMAHHFGGRHTQFRVQRLGEHGRHYIVICPSRVLRNQICNSPPMEFVTPTYNGVAIFTPWTRASGGLIERPSFLLRVRLIKVPIHIWRQDFIQSLCVSFGTVLQVGSLDRLDSFQVLLKGIHPARVPLGLLVSQDPVIHLVTVQLTGWAPLWDPPQGWFPHGPAEQWEAPAPPP